MIKVIVIGGGIIGSAILDKLTRYGVKALLIDKAEDIATGSTKANSGLIHAGFDAEENTNKAKFNVRGNEMMSSLCRELKIPFRRVGAMVVSEDKESLVPLFNRGINNGVKNLSIIDNPQSLEPNLSPKFKYALQAKSAGIISPYMFAIALCEEAVLNGAEVKLGTNIKNISYDNFNYIVETDHGIFKTPIIINAAAHGYNEIAEMLHAETYPIKYRRGEYYVLAKSNFVRRSIFPLPTKLGKGILATPTIDGNILFGPTAEDTDEFDTKTTKLGLDIIKDTIKNMYVNPPFKDAIRQYSGIRVSCGNDFIVEKSKTADGVINICGINSPGLTAAPAIAEYVVNTLLGINTPIKKMLRRKPYMVSSQTKTINKLVIREPSYGKIVCKCEHVSEGEIINAINSPLKPKTIDGIKRRTRSGMGSCQGGYCALKIARLISETHKIPMDKILKENNGSEMMPYGMPIPKK